MARATILSSLGAGLYRVTLHFDNSRIATRLAHMTTKIANYAAELAALEPDKTTKTAALNTALTALNDYINATDPAIYVADPTELNALNKATWTARGELDVILHDEKLLKLKKASLEKETDQLNKLCPADFETNAWCVDYVEDLSGETEAIEIDYLLWRDVGDNQIEHDTGIWLPAATTPATNALIHPLASSEHATWFNLCMAPAAQRHAARYRVATLSNLDSINDTCTVAFDGHYSVDRATGKVIDDDPIYPQFAGIQKTSYANAEIVYGSCNGEAFVNGDRVIVDLHGGVGTPTVIGFYSNPRQCGGGPVYVPYLFNKEQYFTDPSTPIIVYVSGPTFAIATTTTTTLGPDTATTATRATRTETSEGGTTVFHYTTLTWAIVTATWSYVRDNLVTQYGEKTSGDVTYRRQTSNYSSSVSVTVSLASWQAAILGASSIELYSYSDSGTVESSCTYPPGSTTPSSKTIDANRSYTEVERVYEFAKYDNPVAPTEYDYYTVTTTTTQFVDIGTGTESSPYQSVLTVTVTTERNGTLLTTDATVTNTDVYPPNLTFNVFPGDTFDGGETVNITTQVTSLPEIPRRVILAY